MRTLKEAALKENAYKLAERGLSLGQLVRWSDGLPVQCARGSAIELPHPARACLQQCAPADPLRPVIGTRSVEGATASECD